MFFTKKPTQSVSRLSRPVILYFPLKACKCWAGKIHSATQIISFSQTSWTTLRARLFFQKRKPAHQFLSLTSKLSIWKKCFSKPTSVFARKQPWKFQEMLFCKKKERKAKEEIEKKIADLTAIAVPFSIHLTLNKRLIPIVGPKIQEICPIAST